MSATGKIAQVLDALLAQVDTLNVTSPDLPVAKPELSFDPKEQATDGKHLEVAFFPNRPAWEGVSAGVMDQGLLQIAVIWPKNQGLIAPVEIAEGIKAHFPKGLVLTSGTTQVKISRAPWVAQPLIERDRVSVPVTISWTA